MDIHHLIESKQYLVDETKENYYVVYEKFEHIEAFIKGNTVEERNQDIEEMMCIFSDSSKGDVLQRVCSYQLNSDNPSIEDILKKIKEEHSEIFK